jgi:hypothetical protein
MLDTLPVLSLTETVTHHNQATCSLLNACTWWRSGATAHLRRQTGDFLLFLQEGDHRLLVLPGEPQFTRTGAMRHLDDLYRDEASGYRICDVRGKMRFRGPTIAGSSVHTS